ncbi:MAG: ribonuclease J [Mycoplasmatales bacterium]
MNSKFKIIALGGLDENGKNAYVIETEKDMVLIEAGSANFNNKSLGIDLVLPDFSYVVKNKEKLRGILISHGHFDQMGGLQYLLDQVKVPVYSSYFTTEFLKTCINKKNHNLLKEIKYSNSTMLGSLIVEVFSLSHAIFGNFGFSIAFEGESIVYATDYNFDQTTNKFARTDVKKIVEITNKYKVKALLTESVGIENSGMAAGGQHFQHSFHRFVEQSRDRIIISLFSSNLAGMNNIIKIAEEFDRKIVIIGRDLLTYVNISRNSNYISHKRDLFVRIADISKYEDNQLIIVVAGLHDEPYIQLGKMARGTHNIIQIKETDDVLIASKAYDEIETMAQTTLDVIARTHCSIKSQNINVPSHAYQEDVKMMVNLFEPQLIIPIKGEYRKQKAIQQVASTIGYSFNDVHLLSNGSIFEIFDEYGTVTDELALENAMISEKKGNKINPIILKDREVLSDNGYVMIILSFYKNSSEIIQEPEIISGGLIKFDDDENIIDGCRKIIISELQKSYSNRELITKLKTKVSRYLQNSIGKTPMVLPVRMEIDQKRIKGNTNGEK